MTGTGYSITYDEFVHLLTDPAYKKTIVPQIEKWFSGKIVAIDGERYLQLADGTTRTLSNLHAAIQADPDQQYRLYQAAMSLWR